MLPRVYSPRPASWILVVSDVDLIAVPIQNRTKPQVSGQSQSPLVCKISEQNRGAGLKIRKRRAAFRANNIRLVGLTKNGSDAGHRECFASRHDGIGWFGFL